MKFPFRFQNVKLQTKPFPHFHLEHTVDTDFLNDLYVWFSTVAPWKYQEKTFYKLYNLNLFGCKNHLPESLQFLFSEEIKINLIENMKYMFNDKHLSGNMDIDAHRFLPGQNIKAHTDFSEKKQAYRLLIHVNQEWNYQENGGILMFLDKNHLHELHVNNKLYNPIYGSMSAFKISPESYHAVSTVFIKPRYTLSFSFYGN